MILIGIGINGMVVSQSCCFYPTCQSENLCDASTIKQEFKDSSNQGLYFGAILFISTIVTFTVINRK